MLFGIFIIISSFTILLYAIRKPRDIKVTLSGRGIEVDNNLYTYDSIDSFWIFYEPPEIKELSLKSKKTFSIYQKIPIGDADPNKIRNFLLKLLKEEHQEESLTDTIMRFLKF